MEEYFSYDEALEERIREDHEVQDIIDKVGSRAITGMSRLCHWLMRWVPIRHLNPNPRT